MALDEFSGDKALGQDGFSMAFWKSFWDFVKAEVLEFFKEFFVHGRFVRSMNTCLWF